MNILRELRNPFIVRYYDRIVDKKTTTLYIVMEYCAGGDLGKVIKKCKRDRSGNERIGLCSIHNVMIFQN